MKSIKMTLLENSKSFLIESLSKAIDAESDVKQWKYAIFSLVQSIELALKERLRIEHPILIYSNIDKIKHTVSLNFALKRLLKIAKIKITDEDIKTIQIANEWRHTITHYEFNITIQSAKSVFARLLAFLIDFYRHHLKENLEEILSESMWQEVIDIQEYFKELSKRAEARIKEENYDVIICFNCGYDTFVIENNINSCFLCGFNSEIVECEWCNELVFEEEIEEIYTGNYKGLDTWDKVCPKCFKNKKDEDNYEEFLLWQAYQNQ